MKLTIKLQTKGEERVLLKTYDNKIGYRIFNKCCGQKQTLTKETQQLVREIFMFDIRNIIRFLNLTLHTQDVTDFKNFVINVGIWLTNLYNVESYYNKKDEDIKYFLELEVHEGD